MPSLPNEPFHYQQLENACCFFDDFIDFKSASTTGAWTSGATNGTNAIYTSSTAPGAVGGVLELIPSNATPAANDYAAINGLNSIWQLIAMQPIEFSCSIQWTENNTNYANVAFGMASGTVSSLLVNGSAGPATSFNGALIYKTGASTGTGVFKTCSSISTAQTLSTSKTSTTIAQSNWTKLTIKLSPIVGSTAQATAQTMKVTYFCNDQPLMSNVSSGSSLYPIVDTFTFTSPVTTYLYPVLIIKNGATVSGGMENMFIDWVKVSQKRVPNLANPD